MLPATRYPNSASQAWRRCLRPFVVLLSALLCLASPAAAPAFTGSDVDAFANAYNGRAVDYDGLYGAQCVDLFNFYNRDVVRGGWVSGVSFAKDLWTTPATGASYVKVGAGAGAIKGDVAVFGASLGSGAGHVAIVLEDRGGSLRVVQQNWRPFVTTVDVIPKSGLLGYLRPKSLTSGSNPVGNYDGAASHTAGQVSVAGWAFDRDNAGASIDMHVYVGGPAGTPGAEGRAFTANGARPDVNAVHGTGNNHGLDVTFDTGKRGAQQVCLYAINIGGGENVGLGCKTVTIGEPNPIGAFDEAVSPMPGKIKVRGWTFDPNNVAANNDVHVYIGGPAGTPGAEGRAFTANGSRPDVHDVYRTGTNHGVDVTFDTAKRGPQQVCMYAINLGPGGNVGLGCKTVTIATPPPAPTPTVAGAPSAPVSPSGTAVEPVGADPQLPTGTLRMTSLRWSGRTVFLTVVCNERPCYGRLSARWAGRAVVVADMRLAAGAKRTYRFRVSRRQARALLRARVSVLLDGTVVGSLR